MVLSACLWGPPGPEEDSSLPSRWGLGDLLPPGPRGPPSPREPRMREAKEPPGPSLPRPRPRDPAGAKRLLSFPLAVVLWPPLPLSVAVAVVVVVVVVVHSAWLKSAWHPGRDPRPPARASPPLKLPQRDIVASLPQQPLGRPAIDRLMQLCLAQASTRENRAGRPRTDRDEHRPSSSVRGTLGIAVPRFGRIAVC